MQLTHIQKLLFVLSMLYGYGTFAQTNLQSFNIFGQSDILIEGVLQKDGFYKFTLYKSTNSGETKEKTVTFSLRPLTKDAFIQNFFKSYAQLKSDLGEKAKELPAAAEANFDPGLSESEKQPDYKRLEQEASKLFFMFVSGSIVIADLNTEPVAGQICYFDTIQILRRDLNDRSSKTITKRFWQLYKQDRNLLKQLLKAGVLDPFLNDDNANLSDLEIDEQVVDAIKGYVPPNQGATDTLSRKFSFTELSKHLRKREFKKKKREELFQARASLRQSQFEEAKKALVTSSTNLATNRANLTHYQNTIKGIDSLVVIENEMKDLIEKLDVDHKRMIIMMERIRQSPESVFNMFSDNTMIYDYGHSQLAGLSDLRTLAENFEDSFDRFNNCLRDEPVCEGWDKCQNLFSNLRFTIDQGKKTFVDADTMETRKLRNTRAEIVNLKNTLKQAAPADSTAIERRVEALNRQIDTLATNHIIIDNVLDRYNTTSSEIDSLESLFSTYCQTVESIKTQQRQQDNVVGMLEASEYKEAVRQILIDRNNNVKFFGGKDSIDPNLQPDANIQSLNEVKTAIEDDELEGLENDIASLVIEEKQRQSELAQREDELIFKTMAVDSIVLEINEGFIENILMVGKIEEFTGKYGRVKLGNNGKAALNSRTIKFENSSPIGFSRKLDYDALKGKKLYTRGGNRMQYETYLEDAIDIYVQSHRVNRRDYSPANQIVQLTRNDQAPFLCKELNKQATYRLFEAKVFSDFVGLDQTEPNGLIQTEVNKRINLLTSRKAFHFLRLGGLPNEWNIGLLSFIEPSLKLSKIEDNNRYLPLNTKERFINNEYAPIQFASTLSLKQFENFSAGLDVNLLLLDMPHFKSALHVNWGVRYGRTAVQDSVRTGNNGTVLVNAEAVNQFGVNTFSHNPELVLNIYEDERYGFAVSWQHHWFYLRDNRFLQVGNVATSDIQNLLDRPTKTSRQFSTIRFLTYLEPSANNRGRLFFRYTYNWQQGFWRTGFHQAQVGYSFFLLGRQAE